ncbi:MAG TPA: hypothetical protein QGH84_04280 [Rhodospirillales bacterium]|jgi:hypothetical protein|nr:hypothetical protein [Rhodospirillales bacterium]
MSNGSLKRVWKNSPVGFAALVLAVSVLATSPKPAAAETGFTGMQVQGMSLKIAKSLSLKSADGAVAY